jgi:FkbM family methyltransferase
MSDYARQFDRLLLYLKVTGPVNTVRFLTEKLRPRGRTAYASVPNSDRQVKVRLAATDIATYRQVFIYKEYDAQLDFVPRTIIDAGANVGYTAVFFATKYPEARILAIEPDPGNFKMLCENTRDLANVVPIHAALWGANTDVTLFDGGLGEWGFQVSGDGSRAGLKVPALTVQDVMDTYGLSAIDLLKIDIEGSEYEVFLDNPGWIAHVKCVAIELHDRLHKGCTTVFEHATADFQTRWVDGELTWVVRSEAGS